MDDAVLARHEDDRRFVRHAKILPIASTRAVQPILSRPCDELLARLAVGFDQRWTAGTVCVGRTDSRELQETVPQPCAVVPQIGLRSRQCWVNELATMLPRVEVIWMAFAGRT
ncbi:hypothetical protein [Paraburkholderia sp. HD33-4]|uniref:hypothetical protein n=1 Tax=Paraburkholderia sp. HD33-4 TaxID=2883242 RepID=UPI003FA3B13C